MIKYNIELKGILQEILDGLMRMTDFGNDTDRVRAKVLFDKISAENKKLI